MATDATPSAIAADATPSATAADVVPSAPASGSQCDACNFLRRRYIQGCVFTLYFRHKQGFAAIHKIFSAKNASKLLASLPVSNRSAAAFTLSYEAQARFQDPMYGCVSKILALQLQV